MALTQWIHRFIGSVRPAKSDGRLRCIKCRHDLTGLPVDAICPECQEPVLSSALRTAPAVPDDELTANDHPSRQPFEFIREQTGYPVDAYLFVADVLLDLRKRLAKTKGLSFSNTRHVSAGELAESLREFAVGYFGDNAEAREVLQSWNVLGSGDISQIIGRMTEAGLLAAGAHDPSVKFVGLFTLESLFGAEGVQETPSPVS